MANAKQPTQQTHHMETKAFAIQDWIKEEKLVLATNNTKYNVGDHFFKPLRWIKFYQQTDILIGGYPLLNLSVIVLTDK